MSSQGLDALQQALSPEIRGTDSLSVPK